MKRNKHTKTICLIAIFFALGLLVLPSMVSAQSPFPINISAPNTGGEGIAGSINNFYLVALGLGGVAAVGVIVVGALMYATSGAIDKKNLGKELISSAIWGLVLLLGAFIVLNTINPELVQLRNPPGTEYEFGQGRLIEGASCLQYPDIDPCLGGEQPEFDEESGVPSCCVPSGGNQCPASVTNNCEAELYVNAVYGYCGTTGANAKNVVGKVWQYAYYLEPEDGVDEYDLSEEDMGRIGPENAACIPYAIQELSGGEWGSIDKFTLRQLERNFYLKSGDYRENDSWFTEGRECSYYGDLKLVTCEY